MTRTIRIDDEVFALLQKHARPLEDTANSVLRRLLDFDKVKKTSDQRKAMSQSVLDDETDPMTRNKGKNWGRKSTYVRNPSRITGRQLNQEWHVGARHALYHREGTWYNNLQRFPGAMFDPDGYILFPTIEEYRNCPYLTVMQETNVPQGISLIPGYVRVK